VHRSGRSVVGALADSSGDPAPDCGAIVVCQRIVYCRLPIVGGEGDKSDLMVFNKLATFNGFVIKAAHPLSRAIVSFHGVANAVTAMTGMALVDRLV
jgi:hypothetical protein